MRKSDTGRCRWYSPEKCNCCWKFALPEIAPVGACVYSADSMNCIYIAFSFSTGSFIHRSLDSADRMNEIDASFPRPWLVAVQLKPPPFFVHMSVVGVVVAVGAFMSRGNFISVKHPVQSSGVRCEVTNIRHPVTHCSRLLSTDFPNGQQSSHRTAAMSQ